MPQTPVVSIRLDREAPITLGVQLSGQVRHLVQSRSLGPGTRLPSTRALAAELGVARGVVEQAFDQLVAEGWLHTRRGSGTFVADGVLTVPEEPAPVQRGDSTTSSQPATEPLLLDTGTPWVDRRHQGAWRRAWRTVGASVPPARYPDPAGLAELRSAVADYVGRQRGMACTAANIVITSGTAHGLSLLLDVLRRGPVAIEDPGYRAAAAAVEANGRAVIDIPVDDAGLSVADLVAVAGDVSAVYVTPAHQHPLGMPMSAARRVALLAESRRRDILVIEDDYDSEFRYDVAPLPALAQLDSERVVYLGTTSKSLTPALRIGWLVTTPERVQDIARRRESRHDHPSWPMQRALLALFEEGYLDRQIRSARRLYADRSRLVQRRLAPYGSTGASVAGMYVTLQTRREVADFVTASASRQGVQVPSLADYGRSSARAGLVVGFGGVSDAQLDQALDILEAALRMAGEHAGPLA